MPEYFAPVLFFDREPELAEYDIQPVTAKSLLCIFLFKSAKMEEHDTQPITVKLLLCIFLFKSAKVESSNE
ncbi:hypothetical protein LQZ18_17435 [Lachnospiraceae bacterium ZAX-1]